ncbi:MAG: uroporphyrinogen-III synthase [Rhizobiaceae bacterium]|nr:uroporphyrinogen-III synthase [Rhizobiaceae bacterium]
MKRVLVTRPEPGASATCTRLHALGYDPVLLPLTRIFALQCRRFDMDCDAVAVTSVNALRCATEELLKQLSSSPCFVVGARTAEAARKSGFANVVEAEGDVASLSRLIIDGGGVSRIAYLTGRVRLPTFERNLGNAGIKVFPIDLYDTQGVELTEEHIRLLQSGRPIDAALIYSALAAQALKKLADRSELAETFSNTVHCCLSKRIAERLGGDCSLIVRIAERPDEDGMFQLLEN